MNPVRDDLGRIFHAALDAAAPDRLVTEALKGTIADSGSVPQILDRTRGIYALAVGKAAPRMALAIERSLGPRLVKGVAIVPKASDIKALSRFDILEAPHPVPDRSSVRAARAALELAGNVHDDDVFLLALSGGGSAMLAMPAGVVTLEDKVAVTSLLLRAGASIRELNIVRKHISGIKGGLLLRAVGARARVLSLILSDVPGNDFATIASGPAVADPSTYGEAIAVLKRHPGVWGRTPESVREHLELGNSGAIEETIKPRDPAVERVTSVIIGDNRGALDGAERSAKILGYSVDRWRQLRGEANDVARALAAHLCSIRQERLCVIAGGETAVTVTGKGKGGRSQQCALALAIELARIGGGRKIAALFAGTDGIDGPTDAAGAFATPDTVARAIAAGVDPEQALKRNDSYRVFEAIGDLIVTGPTGTNVADVFIGVVNY